MQQQQQLNIQARAGIRSLLIRTLNIEPDIKGQLDVDVTPLEISPRKAAKLNINDRMVTRHLDPVHFTETRSRPSSRPLIERRVGEIDTVAAVKNLTPLNRHWIHWVYEQGKPDFGQLSECCEWAWQELLRDAGLKLSGRGRLKEAEKKRIQELLFLAAFEAKFRLTHGGRQKFKAAKVRQLGRFTESSWKDRWCRRWQQSVAVWLRLDYQALQQIDRYFRQLDDQYEH